MEQGGLPSVVGQATMVSADLSTVASSLPHGGVYGLASFSGEDALALRRRAASDDEDESGLAAVANEDDDDDDDDGGENGDDDDDEDEEEEEGSCGLSRRRPFEPSARSSRAFPCEDEDGAGAAPYEDEDDDVDEDEDGDIEDEGEEDEYVDDRPNISANADADVKPPPAYGHCYPPQPNNENGDNPECPENGSVPSQDLGMANARAYSTQTKKNPLNLDGPGVLAKDQGAAPGADEEKKGAEPFAVPTAGAFYMHDDRFQGATGARHRRSAGGRKLWEAKDEKPWVHDRFEELNLNEERFSRKGSRGRGGRGLLKGRGRGRSSGFLKGRSKAIDFPDGNVLLSYAGSRRGRGIRQRPLRSDNHEDGHLSVKTNSSIGTSSEAPAVSQKPIVNSRLNSESPPFFPSGVLQQNVSGPNTGVTAIPGIGSTSVDARGLDGNMPTTSAKSALRKQQRQSANDEQVFPQMMRLIQNQATDYSELQGSMQGQDMKQQLAQTAGDLPSISTVSNESPSNSSLQEKGVLVGTGAHASPLQIGRGSLMNGGAQSGGLAGVVQFNGQPPLEIGVPAMGMALSSYSGQPQFGFSNSEVTWVPILAGGSSMGTSYSSPYIATMDGNSSGLFYTQPTTQSTPFALPGQSLNALKTSSTFWKPPARPDLANDEFAHRQSKPRSLVYTLETSTLETQDLGLRHTINEYEKGWYVCTILRDELWAVTSTWNSLLQTISSII